MAENFHKVFYKDGFAVLPIGLVLEIVRWDKLVVRSGHDLFAAVVRWIIRSVTPEVS